MQKTSGVIGVISVLALIAGAWYWFFAHFYIAIKNQDRTMTVNFQKVYFPRGGFLKVDRIGIVHPDAISLVQTQYIPPGTYKDVGFTYSAASLDKYPAPSYMLQATLYEDIDGDHIFSVADVPMQNSLGQLIRKNFTLYEAKQLSVSCAQGIEEHFTGTAIDTSVWTKSIENTQNNSLFQQAQYTAPWGATSFYSKKKFVGDVEAEIQVANFFGDSEGSEGVGAKVELLLETGRDRVISVSWVKDQKGSYLTPQASFSQELPLSPHVLSGNVPLGLKLRRVGAIGEVWADEGTGYNRVWEFPIATEDVYMGILTADRGDVPQRVSSQITRAIVACPAN